MISNFPFVNHLPLVDAALEYARAGLKVFPCYPGDKRPMVRWSEMATTDEATIRSWWTWTPNANIGLPMGQGGLHALDMDRKEGSDGFLSYLEAGGDMNPPQPRQTTPGGGTHLFFLDHVNEYSNFARRGDFGGLDMRTDRGYVLAAPSIVKGRRYELLPGDLGRAPPQPLLDTLASFSKPSRSRSTGTEEMPEPSDLEPFEIKAMIESLGGDHTLFLRDGLTSLGDNSRQAYRACWTAFRHHGWSLADMAAIGPHTTLVWFGGEPPHSAHNPWAWCWKYTVLKAWDAARAELERYTPEVMFPDLGPPMPRIGGSVAGPPGRVGDVMDIRVPPEPVDVMDIRVPPEPMDVMDIRVPPDAGGSVAGPPGRVRYEQLSTMAEGLEPGNLRAVQSLVLEIKRAGILPEEEEALFIEIKRFSGYPLKMIRDMAVRMRKEAKPAAKARPVEEVFVQNQNRVYNPRSGQLISREAYLLEYARSHDGRPDLAAANRFFEESGIPIVASLTYHPGKPQGLFTDERGVRLFNTWRPGSVTGLPGSVGPWLGLLESMMPEGGRRDIDDILDRMAFAVQRPGEKYNHGVLLGGSHGIGKDSFLAPFLDVIGRRNVNTVHGSEIAGDFTSWCAQAKVVVLNELDFGEHRDKRKVSEILKPVLAAPPDMLRINEKNVVPYEVPNLTQIWGFTNHRNALHLDTGERRWLAVWFNQHIPSSGPMREQWDKFFESYWTWLENGGVAHVAEFLMSRDISRFRPGSRPRTTDWADDMTAWSSSSLQQWILDGLAHGQGLFALPAVDAETLHRELRGGGTDGAAPDVLLGRNGMPTKRALELALSDLGFPRKRVPKENGRLSRKTLYLWRPVPEGGKWTDSISHLNSYCRKMGWKELVIDGSERRGGVVWGWWEKP